jgi:hypothetical protein
MPSALAIGPSGSWPWWSVRTIIFYGLSIVLWLSYFFASVLKAVSLRQDGIPPLH